MMMIKLISSQCFREASYMMLATRHMSLLYCSIFFVPLVFLRSVTSWFPIRCYQRSISISKLCFKVAGSAVVFHLSGFGPCPCPFPLDPMRLQVTWLLIGHILLLINGYSLSIVRCLLFIVVSTIVTVIAWSSLIRFTGDRLKLTAYSWPLNVGFCQYLLSFDTFSVTH